MKKFMNETSQIGYYTVGQLPSERGPQILPDQLNQAMERMIET